MTFVDFEEDVEAWDLLRSRGYTMSKTFIIFQPADDHVVTDDESAALDYLWLEWDYGFLPWKQP